MPKVAKQWLREILSVIYRGRTLTRADVIEATGLNSASVSHALRYLLQTGTILKVGEQHSNGGRPREVFMLNGEAGYFVAVDLEGRCIRFALTNFVGDIRCRWEEDFDFEQSMAVQKLVDGISRVVRDLNTRELTRVLAVGVSYPGFLDSQGLLTAVNLGWWKFPLVKEFKKALDWPVFLEHDKHTCILAERWLGCASNYSNGLFVIVERGIGVGIFVDGKPLEGWRDRAGELGHCKVVPGAEDLCNCGQRGCLEAIASSPNIVRQYLERSGEPQQRGHRMRVSDVFEKARQGDSTALAVIERAGTALGLALSHLVSLLNPEVIILGGDAISGEDVLLPVIKEEMARRTPPYLLDGVKVTHSGLGLDIRLRGAASLAFRSCLSDPALLRRMCSGVLPIQDRLVPALQS